MPPHVVRAGHVILAVTDLAASRRFYADLLGFNVLHESEQALYLRGTEDREWSLKLEAAAAPSLRQVGFKAGSDQALEQIAALIGTHRWETDLDRPRMLRVQDPFGFPMAFYFQSVRHPWLLQNYDLHRGPGIQRIDHVNFLTPEVAKMTQWYIDQLGFRLTEYSEDDDHVMWATWLHRKGNVHDMALTNGTGPRLHHFAYWMPDGYRISQLCDILAGAGQGNAIERGPGRHGISNAYYLYLRDPDGHRIELYTSDYLTVDPDFEPIRWHIDNPRRQQMWGGIAPKSWFLEGTAVEAFDGGLVPQVESKLARLPRYVS